MQHNKSCVQREQAFSAETHGAGENEHMSSLWNSALLHLNETIYCAVALPFSDWIQSWCIANQEEASRFIDAMPCLHPVLVYRKSRRGFLLTRSVHPVLVYRQSRRGLMVASPYIHSRCSANQEEPSWFPVLASLANKKKLGVLPIKKRLHMCQYGASMQSSEKSPPTASVLVPKRNKREFAHIGVGKGTCSA